MSPRRPPVRPAPPWHFPRPITHQLDNGLTVDRYVLPGQRVITMTLLIDAPLTAEPVELEGVATLAMQARDEGTVNHPGSALTEGLEGCGAAVVGAGASLDGATLSLETPQTRLSETLPLMAELIEQPAYADDDVARLVDDRLLAIATAEYSPPACASKAFYLGLGHHRLARPVGGDADTVANLSASSLHAWQAAAARPERSRLILAGDLPEDTARLTDAALGAWSSRVDVPALPPAVPPELTPTRRVILVDRPGVAQVSVRFGTLTPSRSHEDWAALQVANAVVGSMFGSRLNKVLREEKGLTYGAGSFLGPSRDVAIFMAHAECDPAAATDAIQLGLMLLDLDAAPITDVEARTAIAYITGATPLRMDTASAIAAQATDFALGLVPPDWFDGHMAKVATVSADDATAAFTRHIKPDDLVVAICGDAAALVPQLEAIGLTPEVRQ